MKITKYTGKTLDGSERTITISERTMNKINIAKRNGFNIFITRSYKLSNKHGDKIMKLCQTNDKYRGFIRHAIYAVK